VKRLKKRIAKIILILFMINLVLNIQNFAYAKNVEESSNNSTEKQTYMIKYKDSSKKSELQDTIIQKNGKVKKIIEKFNTIIAELTPEEISNIKDDHNIAVIEQDYVVQTLGEGIPWGVEKIKAIDAHRQGIFGKGINIAIFDTGISEHPDIKISGGVSIIDGEKTYNDENGHGTNVAGVISSQINNEGIIGTAPEVNLYAIKVINSQGIGRYSDIIEGIEWAIDNNINIINMSFGGDQYSKILEEAINMAYENNILIIAASGNNGGENTITYPAKYQNVIAVGAVDKENNLTSFTSTGTEMELVAPGTDILTTTLDGKQGKVEGTSFAASYVTGAAGLLWSKDKTISNTTIRVY
jgi:subtilisin family serine protease